MSQSLAAAYTAAISMYRSGDVAAAGRLLAMNFLMDRSAANWRAEFARLKEQVGDCRTNSPIQPSGVLSGTFQWQCARGKLDGQLLLAPTNPAGIQALRFNVVQQ